MFPVYVSVGAPKHGERAAAPCQKICDEMKGKEMEQRKRLVLWVAAVLLCGALAGCASAPPQSSSPEPGSEPKNEPASEPEQELRQLTMEDILAMNGGEVRYSTDEEGNITFLAGKFYEGKIENGDDVERALWGMQTLIGADEDTVYQKGAGIQIDSGYTYYTLRQWHGDTEVKNAIVKIVVDPDGEAAAISSSVKPGFDAGTELLISPEEAVQQVRAELAEREPETEFIFYDDSVQKASVPYGNALHNVYIVYTNNPGASVSETDFAYLAHYVSANGDYLYDMPTHQAGAEELQSGGNSLHFFEGKTSTTYTGTVTHADGSQEELTVPVLLDEASGIYYLADPERHIALADFWEFNFGEEANAFLSRSENGGWRDRDLLTFENYRKIYDFYHEMGWASVDGQGTPILILTSACGEDHTPIDNAAYSGLVEGWQLFCASDANEYSAECLDVVGHEYTHGVTWSIQTNLLYQKEPGAVNEALSDIMGNIAEMELGATEDTTWAVGENSGTAIRCMTDPHAFGQPAYIGDVFYMPEPSEPGPLNDQGGVHVHNSVLSTVAPLLEKAGMNLEDQARIWLTAVCAATPETNFVDFYHMFAHAAEICGFEDKLETIDEIFKTCRIVGGEPENSYEMADGCGRLSFSADPSVGDYELAQMAVFTVEEEPRRLCRGWPGKAPLFSLQLPEGEYTLVMTALHKENGEPAAFFYSEDGWTQDEDAGIPVSIRAGEETVWKDFTA